MSALRNTDLLATHVESFFSDCVNAQSDLGLRFGHILSGEAYILLIRLEIQVNQTITKRTN